MLISQYLILKTLNQHIRAIYHHSMLNHGSTIYARPQISKADCVPQISRLIKRTYAGTCSEAVVVITV